MGSHKLQQILWASECGFYISGCHPWVVFHCCGSENKLSEFTRLQGEEYKLRWPEKAEFVRAAAKFGAKIVPFCGVGEDDFLRVSAHILHPCHMCNMYSWCDSV